MQASELLLPLDDLLLVTASQAAHESSEAPLLQRKGRLGSRFAQLTAVKVA